MGTLESALLLGCLWMGIFMKAVCHMLWELCRSSSSTCLSRFTSAGVFITDVTAPTSARISANQVAAGGLCRCTCSCWCFWSGRPILASSCWRPMGHWRFSCLQCVHGPCSWLCCWCTGSGADRRLVSLIIVEQTNLCDSDSIVITHSIRPVYFYWQTFCARFFHSFTFFSDLPVIAIICEESLVSIQIPNTNFFITGPDPLLTLRHVYSQDNSSKMKILIMIYFPSYYSKPVI